jgi:hypothetical protein
MSGSGPLRPSRDTRARHVERAVGEWEMKREEREAPQTQGARAWRRAEEAAAPGELEALGRLEAEGQSLEPETLEALENMQRRWALSERLMDRVAPSLASVYWAERDLLLRGLKSLEELAVAERAPLDRRRTTLSTLRVRRRGDIEAGAAPVVDLEQAGQLVDEILEALAECDTKRAQAAVEGLL